MTTQKGTPEENKPCHHCGAEPGERHRDWDDIARCARTGYQLISCEGGSAFLFEINGGAEDGYVHDHVCSPDIWDGEWPGKKACREFGLYCPTGSEFEGQEDLNRLMWYADWDSSTEKWVKR